MLDQHGAVIARGRVVAGWTLAAGSAIGLFSVLSLVRQWGSVYFVLFGTTAKEPTPQQILTYSLTTAVAATAIAAAIVSAFYLGRKVLLALNLVGGVIALGVVFLFAFPADRWEPPAGGNPLPANYHPCYSGSESQYCN